MLTSLIKKILHKSPQRVQVPLLYKLKPKVIVEFIGPAGVGKSTLFRETFTNANFEFYTQNNIGIFENNLLKSDIQNDVYNQLLLSKHENVLKLGENAFVNAKLINYFSRIIKDDIIIQNSITACGFILEEGLSHNFSKELLGLSDNLFSVALLNRVLIYLRPDNPELVVQRIRKRQNEGGHTVVHHSGKTDRELLNIALNSIVNFDNLLVRAKQFAIPYVKISAEDTDGVHRINHFLKGNKQTLMFKI